MTRKTFAITALVLAMTSAQGWSQPIDEIFVSARRLPDSLSSQIYSAVVLPAAELDGAALGLDDALRRVPGFGLFRRQASRAAHPTTQGISLRGLGPNGAGRTLVLLDGVPMNDPFGGWVEWVHLPPALIQGATVVRGGGAGTWGNSALAGAVRLDSRSLPGHTLAADLRYGSKDSLAGSALITADTSNGRFTGFAHASDSDGYFLIDSGQRGSADRPAARSNEGVRLSWKVETDTGTVWSVTANAAADRFVNGSSEAGSETDTYGLSLSAINAAPRSGPAWEAHFYGVRKDFQSVFAAFDGTRDSVRPVLDQFDVPVKGVGANVLLRWADAGAWSVESGADIRFADGETNERFRNLGAGFTRERRAGGEQVVAGTFLEGHRQLSTQTLFTTGIRADYWRQTAGVRQESDLSDGTVLVDRTFASRDGVSVNGRVGVRSQLSESLDIRAAAYSGFRVPTLNELYRPFRVGNDTTEANAGLVNERMVGAEVALAWDRDTASGQVTVFRNDLHDPVLNTTVTTTPGFNTDFGVFIPTGGSLRQRRNVDHVETWGVEVDAAVRVNEFLEVRSGYLFTNPKVAQSTVAPALEGKRLAQVARHQATVGLTVRPNTRLRLSADVLFSSDQFEDDLNTRVLDGAATVDLYAGYQITEGVEVYLAAENLFNTRIEAGRTAGGLVTLGPPVFLWMGLRLKY